MREKDGQEQPAFGHRHLCPNLFPPCSQMTPKDARILPVRPQLETRRRNKLGPGSRFATSLHASPGSQKMSSRAPALLLCALTVAIPAHAFLPIHTATPLRAAALRGARSGVTYGNIGPMRPRSVRGGGLGKMLAMAVAGGGQAPMRDVLIAGAGPAGLGSALELDKVLNSGDQARFRITVPFPDLAPVRRVRVQSLPGTWLIIC